LGGLWETREKRRGGEMRIRIGCVVKEEGKSERGVGKGL